MKHFDPEVVIIEARVNEYSMRTGGAHIPYTADEIVADAEQCREAGAAIVHFHGRTADGGADLSAQTLKAIVSGIRRSTDLLIHPTLGVETQSPDPRVRLAGIEELVTAGVKPDFIPLDMGSANRARLTESGDGFLDEESVYINTVGTLRSFALRLRDLGIKPYLQIWSVPGLRLAQAFRAQGIIDDPIWMSLGLSAEPMIASHPATPAGVRSYLEVLPPVNPQWSVTNFGGNLLAMAESIITRGGHISLGLGDFDYSVAGLSSNAEVVAAVAAIAERAGRRPATPDEAREILALTT